MGTMLIDRQLVEFRIQIKKHIIIKLIIHFIIAQTEKLFIFSMSYFNCLNPVAL
jgi:hypothetical protein